MPSDIPSHTANNLQVGEWAEHLSNPGRRPRRGSAAFLTGRGVMPAAPGAEPRGSLRAPLASSVEQVGKQQGGPSVAGGLGAVSPCPVLLLVFPLFLGPRLPSLPSASRASQGALLAPPPGFPVGGIPPGDTPEPPARHRGFLQPPPRSHLHRDKCGNHGRQAFPLWRGHRRNARAASANRRCGLLSQMPAALPGHHCTALRAAPGPELGTGMSPPLRAHSVTACGSERRREHLSPRPCAAG